jgi:membrane-associated phospholipid phosphatase
MPAAGRLVPLGVARCTAPCRRRVAFCGVAGARLAPARRLFKPAALRLQPVRPAGWWLDLVLVAGFAALTALLGAGTLLDVDKTISDWCVDHRTSGTYGLARAFNFLGNGGPLTVICLLIAIGLAVRGRTARPVLPVAAAFLLTGIAILPIKLWTNRAAPNSTLPDAVDLFNNLPPGEYGRSYPSGHMVNTVIWYGVLALLLAPWLAAGVRRWLRFAPPAIVLVTTVYLNFHWLTDSIAGLLLGVFLDRLLARAPWGVGPPGRGPGANRVSYPARSGQFEGGDRS